MRSNTKKKIAPIVITVLVVLYMLPIVGMVAWAAGAAGASDAAAVIPILLFYAVIGGAIIVGVVAALIQRLREIDGGEEDDAKKY